MKKHITALAWLALALPALALPEAATMEEALPLAKAQNRSIYMELTGNDWCTACIHQRTKILDSAEFEKAVGDKLLLVQVDYPRRPDLVAKVTPEQWKEREALLTAYGIEGLPGAVLFDANGLPFDIIHATRRTPADYLPLVYAAFDKRAARDAALAEAANLQGLDRAKALIKALDCLPEPCRAKYTDIAAEIHALDPNNTLQFHDIAHETQLRIEQTARLHELLKTFEGRFKPEQLKEDIAKLDAFMASPDLVPEVRQTAYRSKGDCYALLRDFESMAKAYKAAVEAAPNTRVGIKLQENIKHLEQNVLPRLKKGKK